MLVYTLNYLLLFLGTGFALARIVGPQRYSLALALPYSYLLILVNILLARLVPIVFDRLMWIIYGEAVFLGVLFFAVLYRDARLESSGSLVRSWLSRLREPEVICWIAVTGSSFLLLTIYLLAAGPYTEIPSDFWRHVGKMQSEFLSLEQNGVFTPVTALIDHLGKEANYWYAAQGLLHRLSGVRIDQAFEFQAFINTSLLLATFFWFVTRVVRWSGYRSFAVPVLAAIASLFFVLHHGTNVFAYVRYYTFAPAFLNLAVLFVFLVLFMDCLTCRASRRARPIAAGCALIILMAVVHLQEALFAITVTYSVLLVGYVRDMLGKQKRFSAAGDGELSTRITSTVFLTATALIIVAVVYVQSTLIRSDPLQYGRLIEASRILPFLREAYVLNPSYQFYETFTVWGYLVVFAFLVCFQWFKTNTFLVAGMATPLLTVFNPIFTDVFLRLSDSWVIWRFLYVVPLSIVGAIVAWRALRVVVRGRTVGQRVIASVALVLLCTLLFPVETKYFQVSYSRIQTLLPVAESRDHRHWADLFEFLNSLDKRYLVLTDPVTGYMVRGLTGHEENGRKFNTASSPGYQVLTHGDYRPETFQRLKGSLVIVNQRPGAYSVTGSLSRHWLGHQLDLPRYYPRELLEFVRDNPAIFTKRWERDDVRVYEISLRHVTLNRVNA